MIGVVGAAEAAVRLGVNRRTVLRLVERGALRPVHRLRRGGAYLFDVADVDRLAAEGIPDGRYKDETRPVAADAAAAA